MSSNGTNEGDLFRYPYEQTTLIPEDPNIHLWMDRDRALEDFLSGIDGAVLPFVVVAQDGTGDYTSIKDAIDGVDIPATNDGPVTIYVKRSDDGTKYDDNSAGRITIRPGLRVNITGGFSPTLAVGSAGTPTEYQQVWKFAGFTLPTSGTGFTGVHISNLYIEGPNASWLNYTSGTGGTQWVFENCYMIEPTAGTSAYLAPNGGDVAKVTMSFNGCKTANLPLFRTGAVMPNLTMTSCTMPTGTSVIGTGATNVTWVMDGCNFQLATAAVSGSQLHWKIDNCHFEDNFTVDACRSLQISNSHFVATLDIDATGNTGYGTQVMIASTRCNALIISGSGSSTYLHGLVNLICGSATLSFNASNEAQGVLANLVITGSGTPLVMSGNNFNVNAQFTAEPDAAAVTLSGNDNRLFYGNRSSVTVTDTGSGNVVNGMPPTGAAGGDLAGTYPNPTVNWASKRYAVNIGDTVATSFTITHNLGTRDVQVQVRQAASTWLYVAPTSIEATTTNTVTVVFGAPPGAAEYRVLVQA